MHPICSKYVLGLTLVGLACGPGPAAMSHSSTDDDSTASSIGMPTTGDSSVVTADPDTTGEPPVATTVLDTTGEPPVTTDSDTTDETETVDPGDPSAHCDEVEFIDAVLEQEIREVVAIPEGPIPGSALDGLQALDLRQEYTGPIAHLGGLECATGMHSLRVEGYSMLGDAGIEPLAALTQLEFLTITEVPITSVAPLAALVGLQHLALGSDDVGDLSPLAGLASLRTLYLDNNPVVDLAPLAGLVALEALDLRWTAVADLAPLTGFGSLRILDLSHTQVADLGPLAGLGALEELDLQATGVTDLGPLSGLPLLTRLEIDENALSDLTPLAGLPIRHFSASDCVISDVGPIATWPTPGFINLVDNDISDISSLVASEWLVAEDACGELRLDGNPLSAQALEDAQALCETHKLLVSFSGGQCGFNIVCNPP